jgi:MFS family permease
MVSSYLLSALSLGALLGGLVYGARHWPGIPERRLRLLMAGLALCYLPLALVPGVAAMTALAGLSGLFLAPSLACAFVVVDRHAPSGTVTEAFSWLVTAFGVGAAGLVALLVMVATGRFLAFPNPAGALEKDPIAAPEPGFTSTHQA